MKIDEELKRYCEERGINWRKELKPKWYEIPFMYIRRRNDYLAVLYTNMELEKQLDKLVDKAKMYYEEYEVPIIAPYTQERISIKSPERGYSDLNQTMKFLNERIAYFKSGPDSIYREMCDQREKVLRRAKFDFMQDVINNMPKDKKVVIIRGNYTPAYEEHEQAFETACVQMAEKPNVDIPTIYCMLSPAWFAFCPEYHDINDQELQETIRYWIGYPKKTKVEYM